MRARGVLLGPDESPQPAVLFVPAGYEERPLLCTVPGCGTRFYARERDAWQRHVGKCARDHLDRIRAVMEKPPLMEDFDPEVTEHMRGVGRRMLEEGRLEVKPSERAGFS